MIRKKKKECKTCKKITYIYAHGNCIYCHQRDYNAKRSKVIAQQSAKDKLFYAELWSERKHECEVCHTPIHEPTTLNFHHILAKAKHPHLRYTKHNIAILCSNCHHQYHFNPTKIIIPIVETTGNYQN